jgi:hypothetical protein
MAALHYLSQPVLLLSPSQTSQRVIVSFPKAPRKFTICHAFPLSPSREPSLHIIHRLPSYPPQRHTRLKHLPSNHPQRPRLLRAETVRAILLRILGCRLLVRPARHGHRVPDQVLRRRRQLCRPNRLLLPHRFAVRRRGLSHHVCEQFVYCGRLVHRYVERGKHLRELLFIFGVSSCGCRYYYAGGPAGYGSGIIS